MTTTLDEHVWRTEDGRHVPHGHVDAAFLAYPAGDAVPDDVLDELTGGSKQTGKPKARRKPANKAKDPGEDKSGSGLTINRLTDHKPADESPGEAETDKE